MNEDIDPFERELQSFRPSEVGPGLQQQIRQELAKAARGRGQALTDAGSWWAQRAGRGSAASALRWTGRSKKG